MMTKPQVFTARLEDKIVRNSKYTEFHFEFINPTTIHNLSGQYVMIDIVTDEINPETQKPIIVKRAYSMCDRPDINHGFEIVVANSGQGQGVKYLESLPFGAEITLTAPLGLFVLDQKSSAKNITFIATGSGIAPIKSMLTDLLQIQGETRPIRLYWGMYEPNDFFWLDDLLDWQKCFPNFKFIPVVTNSDSNWTLSRGLVTDCLIADGVKPDTDFYICGNPNMVKDAVDLLTQTFKVVNTSIHREQF